MNNWKGVGLLLFSAVLAVVAGGIAYLYLKGAPTADAREPETIPVVVASKDLTFATKLTEADVRVAEFPTNSVPSGSYSSVDSVLAQTTKVFLMSGEPVLASKLSAVGGGLSVRVPENMRASSLNVTEVSGVSGFVLPGDRVDVLCTIDNAKDRNVAVTKTILQDIEVLAAGVKTQTTKSDPVKVQAVTVLVDPKGAETLALGMHEGRIHLVLRNPVDHEIVTVKPTDTKEILGLATTTRSSRPRVRRRSTSPSKPTPTVTPDPTYTIIRDGSIVKQKSPTEEP